MQEAELKTQIRFRKKDGSEGVALVDGDAKETLQAKRALADQLNLPMPDTPAGEDIDARLRNGGIDPLSVTGTHISE